MGCHSHHRQPSGAGWITLPVDRVQGETMSAKPAMTAWERIRATLRGDETDRTPVALWQHFPVIDEDPQKLAGATLAFQEKYQWDFVKFTPTGTYGIVDWGAETTWQANFTGVRTVTKFGVTSAQEWPGLDNLDVTRGYLGNQNIALSLTARELKGSVPLVQTIFSPLTTARKLAGERIFGDLRQNPDLFKQGLEIITDVTIRFAQQSLKAGADGLFFATQLASSSLLTRAEYQEFGEIYDLRILQAVRAQAEILALHMHGEDIFFDLAERYPVDIVNWHDRHTAPTLAEARHNTRATLAGGVSEWQSLQTGPTSVIQTELRDAIIAAGGRNYLIAPGCVIPYQTPAAYIRAVRDVVETQPVTG
jgi:uroporphyrinogen decarboxylase